MPGRRVPSPTDVPIGKSAHTREVILARALALFRRRGFEKTTMRDVAKAADVALGAAYYYFPSKEALVLAYYTTTQAEHTELARRAMTGMTDLRARLGAVVHTKLDVLARDRKLLGVLFKSVGDPTDPLSIFGEASKQVRDDSIAIFDDALEGSGLDASTRALTARAIWSLHMGLLLYFLHDKSPKQTKTRELADGALDVAAPLIRAAPMMTDLLTPIAAVLGRAGLLTVT